MCQTFVIGLLFLLPPLFLLFLSIKRVKSNKLSLPPSPPKLPFIGNLHQLGPLPHRSLRLLSDKYGPIMLLQLGQVQTLVISSPEMARDVMKTHDLIFASRPPSKIASLLFFGGRDIGFAPYGEYWRQARKLCVKHLLSAKMVQSFHHVRKEEVESMISKISQMISSSRGVVNMSEVLNSFSCEIICRVVSGNFFREKDRKNMLLDMTREVSVLTGAFHLGDFFPVIGNLDILGLDKRAKRNNERWDNVFEEVLKDHANKYQDEVAHDTDFVDVLLSLEKGSSIDYPFERENIKAILLDMFAAGTDTTYIVLEWSMAELVCNQIVLKKLQDEVRGVANGNHMFKEDDLRKLNYLKAVVKEVMRLHPPGPLLLPRQSTESCEIAGYHIPKETRVIVNAWVILRDPNVWDEPDEFKPERFVNNHLDFKGNDFQFIPFGAGRRICPGMNFAVQDIELALANLVHRFDWELPGDMRREDLDMSDAPGITIRRKERLQLAAKLFSYQ